MNALAGACLILLGAVTILIGSVAVVIGWRILWMPH